MTESLLLSLIGGVCGLLLAQPALRIIVRLHGLIPRSDNISIDFQVVWFTFAAAVLVAVLFGLAPALRSSRADVQTSLRSGSRGATGTHHRTQNALVVVQMAFTVVLLAGCGLLLRSVAVLLQVNPGFDARQVVAFRVGLSPSLTRTALSTRIAFRQLLDRIRSIPGVESADVTNLIPLNGDDNSGPFWLGTEAPASEQDAPHALYFWTGPDYLRTMKIRLLQGRFFTTADTQETDCVIVIDNDLAHEYFSSVNPLGQVITVAHWGSARVVGVVGHVRHWGLDDPATYNPGQIYIPVFQLPDYMALDFFRDSLSVVVRTPVSPDVAMPEVKRAAQEEAADQTIYNVEPMEEIVSASMAPRRLPLMLLGAFATLALVLATVGIYGVVSHSVTQRVQEIGIRMALGASRRSVLRMVIRGGLRHTVAGLVIGVLSVLALGRILMSFSSLLYGVKAADPLTLLVVSLVLALAAGVACIVPARRAMHVDPMEVLRSE